MLIGVDRIAARARRDIRPPPHAAGARAAIQLDRAPIDDVRVGRRHREAPVVPRLRHLHARGHRFGREIATGTRAPPQQRAAADCAGHVDDARAGRGVAHLESFERTECAGQGHSRPGAAAVARAEQAALIGQKDFARIGRIDRDVPGQFGAHLRNGLARVARFEQPVDRADPHMQRIGRIDREIVDAGPRERLVGHVLPGEAAVRGAQQPYAERAAGIAFAGGGVDDVG